MIMSTSASSSTSIFDPFTSNKTQTPRSSLRCWRGWDGFLHAFALSVYVDLHGTGKGVSEDQVEAAIRKSMDLSPTGIRRHLDLNKPIYAKTSAYGHFGRKAGRDGSFSWERTDLVKALKEALKTKEAA